MELSPTERREVLDMLAEKLFRAISANHADLSELVVLPLATASQLLGLSPKTVARLLPITQADRGKRGVTMAAIKNHITQNTER